MKRILLPIAALFVVSKSNAQDLPPNAEPGKCYIQCKVEDQWGTEEVKVQVKVKIHLFWQVDGEQMAIPMMPK